MIRERICACVLALGMLTGFTHAFGSKDAAADGKPLVVTTIGMIADAVKNIAQGDVHLKGLMGPGVDPHLYTATAGDVEWLGNADLILYNGLHLETKMGEVFSKLRGSRLVVAVSETIPVSQRLSLEEAEFDPHVWFDVKLWSYSVKAVYESLCKLLPGKTREFTQRYQAYQQQLDKLDAYVRRKAQSLPAERRVLVTAHDAFGYFSRAYGFEVKGLQGVSTASEASAHDMQELAAFIAQRKLPAIFIESSIPHKNVEALRDAVQARGHVVQIGGELFSDAMGDAGTSEGTYVGMVTHNIDTIVAALTR